MPKFRKLWTKTIDSFDFNEMPDDFTRVVWLLLPLILDSEGRGIDSMPWVRSRMFPLREIDLGELSKAFDWLVERNMIVRYQVNNRSYFYARNFKTYQSGTEKESPSELPAPLEQHQINSRVGREQVDSKSRADQAQVSVAASASASVNESVLSENAKNLFRLYEQEIGPLTPIISDELKDAETEYPLDWFRPAFQEAARNNKRSWAYAKAILRRWKTDGFKSKSNANGHKPAAEPKPREEY